MPMPATATPIVPTRQHLDALFAKIDPVRGRLIFGLDYTVSRQPTIDVAAQLQGQMFETATATGGLDVQLVFYRGYGQCTATRWMSDAKSLAAAMNKITCASGPTQIGRVLTHARRENLRERVNALVLISDACEEETPALYAEAHELGLPTFMFQEGSDDRVAGIYAEIARITNGAVERFDNGATQRLADLLRAVAAFSAGGLKALEGQKTEAAMRLLTQLRK